MKSPVPDSDWYFSKSKEMQLPLRCPFANVNACPRFYASLSLMGQAGSTKISEDEDARLLASWEKSPLWPVTAEQDTSLSGDSDRPYFGNFCPEVMHERFGLFVSTLGQYIDDIDRDAAHRRLLREGADRRDPAWSWAFLTARHFSECSLYSQLSHDWIKAMPQITQSKANPPSNKLLDRYDIFVSHASEDKASFVRELVAELRRFGLTVWFDESEIEWGDSLRPSIETGLSRSRFGIVVLSKSFVSKKWPNSELDALFAREIAEGKVILPIRHELNHQEVIANFPLIAGKVSASSDEGVEAIAQKALDLVRPRAKK